MGERAYGTPATCAGPLLRAGLVAGDDVAVVCAEARLTYGELLARVRRLGGALRALGLRRGDRVAVLGPNCHSRLELHLAVPAMGFVLVPLHAGDSERELRHALADSGARVLFAGGGGRMLADAVEHWLSLDDDYEPLVQSAEEAEWPEVAEDDLAALFYVGHRMGAPKGVMLTHGNLVANALHFMACRPFTRQTAWLLAAPMSRVSGTIGVLATVWGGGRHVALTAWDAGAALDVIERERVTATHVTPTMLSAMVDEQLARPRDVRSVTWLSRSGAPAAVEAMKRTYEAFPKTELVNIYETTETAQITALLPDGRDTLDRPMARSCGQPVVGVELQIADGREVPQAAGIVGAVRVRGRTVTPGYWNNPQATGKAITCGWYATGDLGFLDGDGYLYLVDRAPDVIVTGDESVRAIEVEEALSRHPVVQEVAAFGVPDPRRGEAVHAVVVASAPVSEEELVVHCQAFIAGYKLPRSIELRREPLPKSGTGKIRRRELRERHWMGRPTRIGAYER